MPDALGNGDGLIGCRRAGSDDIFTTCCGGSMLCELLACGDMPGELFACGDILGELFACGDMLGGPSGGGPDETERASDGLVVLVAEACVPVV
jgi:hypothetical protein